MTIRLSMRWVIGGIISLFITGSVVATGIEFIRVWPAWRDASHFERISEFLGLRSGETHGREIVLRTDLAARAGYYFLVRVDGVPNRADAKFEISVIRPDALKPFTFEFPVVLRESETVYQLGLTGTAWPDGSSAHPVAWQLRLLANDGRMLAEQKSFLWEKPLR